jgi:hypothetical protein
VGSVAKYERVVAMTESARICISVAAFSVAILMGALAFSTVFSRHPIVFSNSPRQDEIIVDLLGIVASAVALTAATVAYPLRRNAWIRLYLFVTILVALSLALEFLLGFIWFALDKFVPFKENH